MKGEQFVTARFSLMVVLREEDWLEKNLIKTSAGRGLHWR